MKTTKIKLTYPEKVMNGELKSNVKNGKNKNMKFLIVLNDWLRCDVVCRNTGHMPALRRRAVEIQLTKDQIDKIGLRKVGLKNLYEEIESISLLTKQITDE